MKLSIGGCAYMARVRTEHASRVAALAAIGMARSLKDDAAPRIVAFDYQHTSNLPQGRAQWLRRQIGNIEIDAAITMDADTWFRDVLEMHDALAELRTLDTMAWAIAIAPVRQGGTDKCNLRWLVKANDEGDDDDDEAAVYRSWRRTVGGDVTWHNLSTVTELGAGGFGIAVFNLVWFRQRWPEPAPEHVAIDTGEDIEMCISTRRRGGNLRVLQVGTVHREFQP